jgi:hypothetical protein
LSYQQQQTIRLPVEINGDFPHRAENPEDISELPYQQQQTIRLPVERNGDFPRSAENPGYRNFYVELPANT